MRKFIRLCSTIALASLLSACASQPKVRVDKDAGTNLAAYKTFGWFAEKKDEQADSLVSRRVRTAVIASLQSKGYALNEAAPDVQISYALRVYEKPKDSGMRIGVGAGGGSGNVAGGVGLSIPVGKRNENVAAMTLDAVDPTRKAQVWTASYEMRIAGQDITDAEAQKLIDILLEKYPRAQ